MLSSSKKNLEVLRKSARKPLEKAPSFLDNENGVIFLEGTGSLPIKPFPTLHNDSKHKLLENDPNIEYHDHGPRDKCDTDCRFFKAQQLKSSTPPIITKSQIKNGLK